MNKTITISAIGAVMAFLVGLLWQSFHTPTWTSLGIGGPNYPTIVLIAAFAFFAIHGLRLVRALPDEPAPSAPSADPDAPARKGRRLKMAAFVLLWLGYIAALPFLGFTVATIAAASASVLILQRANPLIVLASASVAILAMVVLFRRFLYVATPQGPLDRWLESTLFAIGL